MWFGICLKPILHTKTLPFSENIKYILGFKLLAFKIYAWWKMIKSYAILGIQKVMLIVILRSKAIVLRYEWKGI